MGEREFGVLVRRVPLAQTLEWLSPRPRCPQFLSDMSRFLRDFSRAGGEQCGPMSSFFGSGSIRSAAKFPQSTRPGLSFSCLIRYQPYSLHYHVGPPIDEEEIPPPQSLSSPESFFRGERKFPRGHGIRCKGSNCGGGIGGR